MALPDAGPERPWILVPLGNPGPEYADTRHNLGRILVQRWMERREAPRAIHPFPSGTLYGLGRPFMALVPATYMNHSGRVVAEAVAAGFDPTRMIVLLDDKDLPLGLGRLRVTGGDGGHNGMRSILEALDRQDMARLRLGIGPFERPLADFVLGTWTEAEWEVLDTLDAPFAAFMDLLGRTEDLAALMGAVNGEAFWNRP